MGIRWLAIAWFTIICGGVTGGASISPERVSIYEVPFLCPVAPQIGCGSRSKPVLVDLEANKSVAEAWLNRAGTRMAIVWKRNCKPTERIATLKDLTRKDDFAATELTGTERNEALRDFYSRKGWLRGRDVDHLSQEEAGIVAGRLVKKVRSLVSLSEQQASILKPQFTRIIGRRLTAQLPDRAAAEEEILKVLRKQLSERDVETVQQALKNYRPNHDEP